MATMDPKFEKAVKEARRALPSPFTRAEDWIKNNRLLPLSNEQKSAGLSPEQSAARAKAKAIIEGPVVAPAFEFSEAKTLEELVGESPLLQKAGRMATQAEEELAAELRRGRLFDLSKKYGQKMRFRRTLDGAIVEGSIALFKMQPPGLYFPVVERRFEPADPKEELPEKVSESEARARAIQAAKGRTLSLLDAEQRNQIAGARETRRIRLGLTEEEMTAAQRKGLIESDEDIYDLAKTVNIDLARRLREEQNLLDLFNEHAGVSATSLVKEGDPLAIALKEEGLLASTYPAYMTIAERRLAQNMAREGFERALAIEDRAVGVSDRRTLELINEAATAARDLAKVRAKDYVAGIIATRGGFTDVEKVFRAAANTVDGIEVRFPGGGTLGLGKASTLNEAGQPMPRGGDPIVMFRVREILDPVKRDELGAKSEKIYLEKVEGDFPSRKRILRFRMAGTRAQIEVDPDRGPIVGLKMKPAPEKERLSETAPKRTKPPTWEAIQEERSSGQPGPSNNDFRRASRGEIGKDVAFRWGEQAANAFWEHLAPIERETIERAKGDAVRENLEGVVRTPEELLESLGDELSRVERSIGGREERSSGEAWEDQYNPEARDAARKRAGKGPGGKYLGGRPILPLPEDKSKILKGD